MTSIKPINSAVPATRKGQTQPVEATNPQMTTPPQHDRTTAAVEQALSKLDALLEAEKLRQGYGDGPVYCHSTMGRP